MLRDKILSRALDGGHGDIFINRSRCVKMRFNKSSCSICESKCPSGAVTVGKDVVIKSESCSYCMICVSACPSGCFEMTGADFYALLGRLRKLCSLVLSPVLGCSNQKNNAHEKIFCPGFLSEEHLIALSFFIEQPLQLNLTCCNDCGNKFIPDILKERLNAAKQKTGMDCLKRIILIEDRNSLDFKEASYDRRSFFNIIRNMFFVQAAELFEDKNEDDDMANAFSTKKLPLKREILNKVLERLGQGREYETLIEKYGYTVSADETCSNCFSCVGACPTGALKVKSDSSGVGLLFNASMCGGCGLCAEFCMSGSMSIKGGFSGNDFFEFYLCNPKAFMSHEEPGGDHGFQDAEECYK